MRTSRLLEAQHAVCTPETPAGHTSEQREISLVCCGRATALQSLSSAAESADTLPCKQAPGAWHPLTQSGAVQALALLLLAHLEEASDTPAAPQQAASGEAAGVKHFAQRRPCSSFTA